MTKKISSQTLNLNFSLFCDPIHSIMNNKSSMGEFTQNSAAWHIFDGVRVRFYPFSHCKIKWQHSNEKHQIILTTLGNFWVFWIVYTQFPHYKSKNGRIMNSIWWYYTSTQNLIRNSEKKQRKTPNHITLLNWIYNQT